MRLLIVASLLLAAPAAAQPAEQTDSVEQALQRIIEHAKRRLVRAESDLDVVQTAITSVHSIGRSDGEAIRRAIAPVRARHPVPNLAYSGSDNWCRMLNSLRSLRGDAYGRMASASADQASSYGRLLIYQAAKTEVLLGLMSERPRTTTQLEAAVLRFIDVPAELAQDGADDNMGSSPGMTTTEC